jgi:very-short-patch-repair endonuclease
MSVSLELRRPFTRADALAAGISPSMLKGSRFRRLFRGVYIDARVPPHPQQRIEAALLLHPAGAFASHASAARLYGVPLPLLPDEHVTVLAAADRRPRPGLRSHLAPPDPGVADLRGLRVSAAAQMFVAVASLLELVDLVVVGDALVRLRRVGPDELRAFCGTSSLPGARQAGRAASSVRARVDSPMESRLRMLIVLAGLPEPAVDFRIHDRFGRVLYRFDLSYPGLKIVVEYDGRQHRADPDQWDHDTDRKDWFDPEGWLHVPVFSRGVYRDPDKTIRRVEAALRSRGAVLPRRLADDWRPFFPQR